MSSAVAFCDVHGREEIAVQRCKNHRPHHKYEFEKRLNNLNKCIIFLCSASVGSSNVYFSFVNSLIRPDTGRPLSKAEFERARRTPPRLPDPSHPKHRAPPIDRPPYWNRNYLSYTFLRWPNRRVPYTIDSGFNDAQRTVIAQVRTMVKFRAFITSCFFINNLAGHSAYRGRGMRPLLPKNWPGSGCAKFNEKGN